ncbi:hypothetical protein [Ponticaulis sp.]|uniref:hypothetical protein n=1 Tax=Ponticaulis sp. TaxID=2020902 RepID=UPI0025FBDEBB|nr:hypothetical protein [Ponticaulis sp.]|tara:strand:+ start:103991 stop:104500 length:510 start_codon:yes stop_codon:yes gene_type:complete
MTVRNVTIVSVFSLMLMACSSTTTNAQTSAEAPPGPNVPPAIARAQAPRAGLAPQTLAVGECGLFLWTRREQPEFVFFSKAGTEQAKFWHAGQTHELSRIAVGGQIFGQQLSEQDFSLPDGRSAELRMTPGEMLVGGQRIPEASLTIIDAEGWRTMIPVAGVTACQPEV